MNHRWYDHDPTLSMALSLLHNASKVHQDLTAQYMMSLIHHKRLLKGEAPTGTAEIRFFFLPVRRNGFESRAKELVEILKRLEPEGQQAIAVALIDYMYILDCGMHTHEDELNIEKALIADSPTFHGQLELG